MGSVLANIVIAKTTTVNLQTKFRTEHLCTVVSSSLNSNDKLKHRLDNKPRFSWDFRCETRRERFMVMNSTENSYNYRFNYVRCRSAGVLADKTAEVKGLLTKETIIFSWKSRLWRFTACSAVVPHPFCDGNRGDHKYPLFV